jgi:hypothetical protein
MSAFLKYASISLLLISISSLYGCGSDEAGQGLERAELTQISQTEAQAQFISSQSVATAQSNVGVNEGVITGVLAISEFVINGQAVTESSGLARSNLNPELLWTHNDSGSGTVIHALTLEGSHIATASLDGPAVINLDWEDMTSFVFQNRSFLLVADVGDNSAVRPVTTLYLVEEPAVDMRALGVQNLSAKVLGVYVVAFPDLTPRDVEAVAVDVTTRTAYLITKRESRPTLYSFSLGSLESAVGAVLPVRKPVTLKNEGPIIIPRASGSDLKNPEAFNWVTSMDIDEKGSRALLTTLTHGYIYQRAAQQTWMQAFQQKPYQFPLPKYSQIEAGTWLKGRDSLMITSENVPARMARFDLGVR